MNFNLKRPINSIILSISIASSFLLISAQIEKPMAQERDTCVECHSNSDFLVTNKKLYEYFKEWKVSAHGQKNISCVECHEGNSKRPDKEGAHGGISGNGKPIDFKNIPVTCSKCHEDYYKSYMQSKHFEHLVKAKQQKQGPNCVTCHESMNVTVLKGSTIETMCSLCHNKETNNHPDAPVKAKKILNNGVNISRYYNYIKKRIKTQEGKEFIKVMDKNLYDLSLEWHTFDLSSLEKKSREFLDKSKAKRQELKKN
ncbi:MAG: hypothetical protein HQM13_24035 [SAR324 cluster bacterium]|nr:hypothetical protein [SAR324 cluster bacterium]